MAETVKHKINLRELGGAFGDWGTLIPFIIGYVAIVGLNPAGIFICLGLANIILGIRFNLPLPVQPQKTIGTVAIAQKWNPELVISTGFGTGIVWAILGISKKLNAIVRRVPKVAVRGVQLGLGLILGWSAFLFFLEEIWLGLIAIGIIIIFMRSERVPSAIILTGLGIVITFLSSSILFSEIAFQLPQFSFFIPNLELMIIGFILAGIAQLFLTLTNVMIATIALMHELFPDKKEMIDANTLALNMGAMNIVFPFIGGMPTCHGSGGLAAQYAFGARTGGSLIFEGLLELILGLFFSNTLFMLFSEFPRAILGAMLLYTAYLLGKISMKNFHIKRFPIILLSAVLCMLFNITFGFLAGLSLYFLLRGKLPLDEEKDSEKEEEKIDVSQNVEK